MRLSTAALSWALAALASVASAFPSPLSAISPRVFDFTLTWEDTAPDGAQRKAVPVNGMYPGPVLEANQGEKIRVTVHNKMPFNTTLHFHGTWRSPDRDSSAG